MKKSQVNFITSFSLIITLFFGGFNSGYSQSPDMNAVEIRQGKDVMSRMNMRRNMGRERGELNIPDLTDKQKEQIKGFKLSMKKEVLQLTNQLGEENAKLRTLTTLDKVDMKAINKTIDEIGEIKTKIHKEKVSANQKIRSILTEDQRIEFDVRVRMHQAKKRGRIEGNRRPIQHRNARY